MPSHEGVITRLIARLKALLPNDWKGRPGERFQKATQAISDFAEEHHITPNELLDEGVELGRRKIEGAASHEYAQALKNFAEAEKIKTEAELQRRSMETEVSRRAAEARRAHAEAHLAELTALQAELELLQKLKSIGVVLHRDVNGNLTALPAPQGFDLMELVDHNRLAEAVLPVLPDGITLQPDGIHVHKSLDGPVAFPEQRITVEADVLVAGEVRGATVVILPGATVHGNVSGEAEIHIRNGAKLVGDIRTAKILIEDGAYFKGSIDIVKPVV
jgi:uncharacterized protein YciI